MYINKDKNNQNKKISNESIKEENEKNTTLNQLYKTIQNEIKNIVISRLHNQVAKLTFLKLIKLKKYISSKIYIV